MSIKSSSDTIQMVNLFPNSSSFAYKFGDLKWIISFPPKQHRSFFIPPEWYETPWFSSSLSEEVLSFKLVVLDKQVFAQYLRSPVFNFIAINVSYQNPGFCSTNLLTFAGSSRAGEQPVRSVFSLCWCHNPSRFWCFISAVHLFSPTLSA